MRLLAAPWNEPALIEALASAHDVVTMAHDGRAFHDVLADLPAGWVPDAVVLWSPEFYTLPPGLEASPFPVVFVVGDWNLGLSRMVEALAIADLILADRRGVEALRRWGYANVHYWPAYTHNPAVHRRRPDAEIKYDVSFIGSFNHAIHQVRARRLARLAQFSDRYRIGILTNVHGDAYGQVLSESRIVFNSSVRGEMNMRAYEATAAGRLLLMEAANVEVGDFLHQGEEYVAYDDEHFERCLQALLDDPERCERIAGAGHERMRDFSPARQLEELRALLAGQTWPGAAQRRWWQYPPQLRKLYLARQALLTLTPNTVPRALSLIQQAAALDPLDPTIRHTYAVTLAYVAVQVEDDTQREQFRTAALQEFQGLLDAHPRYSLAWCNYGRFLEALDRTDGAVKAWEQSLQTLPDAVPFSLTDPLFPPTYDRFRVEWERCTGQADLQAAKGLLGAALSTWIAGAVGAADPPGALALLQHAVALDPASADAWRVLGDLCLLQGDRSAACQAWQQSIALQPYQFPLRQRLIDTLLVLHDTDRAERCLIETERMIRASFDAYGANLPAFQQLRAKLGQGRRAWRLQPDWTTPVWLAPLQAYCQTFHQQDPVALYLVASPDAGWDEERVLALVGRQLGEWGFDPDQVADLLIVNPGDTLPDGIVSLPAEGPVDWAEWFAAVPAGGDA